jgi:hypothetical protein
MRNPAQQFVLLLLLLAATACPSVAMGESAKELSFVDLYLKQLASHGRPVKMLSRNAPGENLGKWKGLIEPTFPIGLRFDLAEHLILREEDSEKSVALFVFRTPDKLKASFTSFSHLAVSGTLRSKVQTYYNAVADDSFFVILVCEQTPVPSESRLVLELPRALAELRESSK